MEEKGLVRRERDTRIWRIWRIWLTDSGRELQEVLPPLVAEIRCLAVEGISQGRSRTVMPTDRSGDRQSFLNRQINLLSEVQQHLPLLHYK